MIPQLGPLEIVVVVLVALLVFGPHRMPEVGRQVGRGLRQIRRIQEQVREELDAVLHPDEASPSPHADDAVVSTDRDRTAPSRFRPPEPAPGTTRANPGRSTPVVPEVGRAPSRFRPPAAS